MASVFVSYAREDAARAEGLATALECAGHSVWWDRHIAGGAEFSGEIEAALEQADVVVVGWSKASVRSSWVRDEAAIARDSGRLVPVLLDSTPPPLGFRQLQAIDLSKWSGRANAKAVQDLRHAVETKANEVPAEPPSVPAPTRRFDGRGWLLAIAVVAAATLLLGLGAAYFWRGDDPDASAASLAVLPFSDLSPARDHAFFAEGLAEEILAQLSREPAFRVAGRTSSWAIRDASSDLKEVGRKLNVTYVLEGSVRRADQRVRVNVALVKTADGSQLWSDTYDGRLDDIFAIQDQIGGSVAASLKRRLIHTAARPDALKTRGDVYSLYLTARAMLRDREPAKARAAAELLKRSVKLDPNYAPAWASLAHALRLKNSFEHSEQQQRDEAMALRHAQRALKLAPDLAEAHVSYARLVGLDSAKAASHLARAVQLEPRNAEVQFALATALRARGDFTGELRALDRAAKLDPLMRTISGRIARSAAALGQDEIAHAQIGRLQRAGSADTRHIRGHYFQAKADFSRAIEEYEQARLVVQQSAGDRIEKHIGELLFMLGYSEEAQRTWSFDPDLWKLMRAGVVDASELRNRNLTGPINEDDAHYTSLAAKIMLGRGQAAALAELLEQERGLLPLALDRSGRSTLTLIERAPLVAQALEGSGRTAAAKRLLSLADGEVAKVLQGGPVPNWFYAKSAEIWALRGKREEALSALERAVSLGWVYIGPDAAADISNEPAFRSLRTQDRFQRVRHRLQIHRARERAEVGATLKTAARE